MSRGPTAKRLQEVPFLFLHDVQARKARLFLGRIVLEGPFESSESAMMVCRKTKQGAQARIGSPVKLAFCPASALGVLDLRNFFTIMLRSPIEYSFPKEVLHLFSNKQSGNEFAE